MRSNVPSSCGSQSVGRGHGPVGVESRGPVDSARVAAPRRSAEHWIVLLGSWLGVLGLAGFGLALQVDPRGYGTHEQLGLLPCLPMVLWRLPCPGCGVTTSVVAAVHGDLRTALVTQPFGLFVVLATVAIAAWGPLAHLRGRDLKLVLATAPLGRIALGVGSLLALCWIYKVAAVRGWIG